MIKIAIAVTQGHVQRALEFYKKLGKYFIIGGTQTWEDESNPPSPSIEEYKLKDVVGLKRVDDCQLVVPDENGEIEYRTQKWRKVSTPFYTQISTNPVSAGNTIIQVNSMTGMVIGGKLRIGSTYEGKITAVNFTTNQITLDTPAPSIIPVGATVEGGALVEGAKYVYIDCYLSYNQFPIVTYRQIGLCTEVLPNTENILRSAAYSASGNDEYTSLGVLEIIDNRSPSTRDIDQQEMLSLIVEF